MLERYTLRSPTLRIDLKAGTETKRFLNHHSRKNRERGAPSAAILVITFAARHSSFSVNIIANSKGSRLNLLIHHVHHVLESLTRIPSHMMWLASLVSQGIHDNVWRKALPNLIRSIL